VIGGGSSLKGFDFESIRPYRSIGCNAAWKNSPDICLFTDHRYSDLVRESEEWSRTKTILLFHECNKQYAEKYPGTYWLKIQQREHWGSKLEHGIRGLNNTGASAVNLADVLGCNPIFLLGFDMTRGEGKATHYHDEYPNTFKQGADIYRRFQQSFEEFAAKNCRAKIFNLSPISTLECFPKITVEKALRVAAKKLSEKRLATA